MSIFTAAAQDEDGDTIKTLQARVADLEAQLYAVGAGGVGKLEQPQSVTNCHQSQPKGEQPTMTPVAQRKLDDLLTRGYQISGYSVYHDTKHQHGFVTTAGLVGWWKPEGAEYPQPQGKAVGWLPLDCRGGYNFQQPQGGEQEPLFWYRPRRDGLYEGPLHKSQIERVRKESGGWVPLYTRPQPPRQQPQVEQDPIAVVTGFYGGFPTIRPLEPATVLPYGMALYAHPQPPFAQGEKRNDQT